MFETNPRISFLLAGRILLIFLFLGFILQGSWSIARVFVSVVGLAACIMVAVGFKAKWSAAFLVLVFALGRLMHWYSMNIKYSVSLSFKGVSPII